jgi:Xaa-Pro aminopeptidase
MRQSLPDIEYVHWDEPFKALQMIKDADEVEAIASAGRITRKAIETAFAEASPDSTERAVARAIFNGMMDAGITPMFNVFVSGPRTLLAHGDPSDRVMQPGDIIRLDVVGRSSNHYLADMARTGVVGESSAEQQALFRKIYNAQRAVIDAVAPGRPVSELYNICAKSYDEQGIPFSMPHIGHGMGIGLHEAPMIHPNNHTMLQVGMVLNIEPFLAVKERQETYHVEDLVVVTAEGSRLLTTPQEALLQIPVS